MNSTTKARRWPLALAVFAVGMSGFELGRWSISHNSLDIILTVAYAAATLGWIVVDFAIQLIAGKRRERDALKQLIELDRAHRGGPYG